jgi:hypothetical protein
LQYRILPRALNKNNEVSLPPIDANSDSFSPWLSAALDDFDFALDLRQFSGFLRGLWFPQPIKLTATI